MAEKVARRSAGVGPSGSVTYETPETFGRRYNRSARWVRARAAQLGAIRDGSGTGSRYLIPVAAGDAAMQLLLVADQPDATAGLKTAKARARRSTSRNGNALLPVPVRAQLPLR